MKVWGGAGARWRLVTAHKHTHTSGPLQYSGSNLLHAMRSRNSKVLTEALLFSWSHHGEFWFASLILFDFPDCLNILVELPKRVKNNIMKSLTAHTVCCMQSLKCSNYSKYDSFWELCVEWLLVYIFFCLYVFDGCVSSLSTSPVDTDLWWTLIWLNFSGS